MINLKIKLLFFGILSLILVSVPLTSVRSQGLMNDINTQNQVFAGEKGAGLSNSDPRLVAAQGIKVVLGILGTLLTAWTVYGGFLILTSAGDEEKMSKGRSVITNGVIGLIIILSAYSIASFVSKLWAQPATQFEKDPKPVIDTNLYQDPNAADSQAS